MARRRRAEVREMAADPVYNSTLVEKFINSMMWDGKKNTSCRIFYDAMSFVEEKGGDEALKIFRKAVENCKPLLEVKSRRVGGATYQVPLEVAPERQEALAMRWMVTAARKRKGIPMHIALANEIRDAATNTGSVIRKRDETHKMAQANRAFAHFRW